MRVVSLIALCGAMSLAAGACNNYDEDEEAYAEGEDQAYAEGSADGYETAEAPAAGSTTTNTTYVWPAGARIVVEDDVTYRIDPSGTRVRLGPNDARIVVEDGVRYRVDPGGARVRIDDRGVALDVGDVEVDINP